MFVESFFYRRFLTLFYEKIGVQKLSACLQCEKRLFGRALMPGCRCLFEDAGVHWVYCCSRMAYRGALRASVPQGKHHLMRLLVAQAGRRVIFCISQFSSDWKTSPINKELTFLLTAIITFYIISTYVYYQLDQRKPDTDGWASSGRTVKSQSAC